MNILIAFFILCALVVAALQFACNLLLFYVAGFDGTPAVIISLMLSGAGLVFTLGVGVVAGVMLTEEPEDETPSQTPPI